MALLINNNKVYIFMKRIIIALMMVMALPSNIAIAHQKQSLAWKGILFPALAMGGLVTSWQLIAHMQKMERLKVLSANQNLQTFGAMMKPSPDSHKFKTVSGWRACFSSGLSKLKLINLPCAEKDRLCGALKSAHCSFSEHSHTLCIDLQFPEVDSAFEKFNEKIGKEMNSYHAKKDRYESRKKFIWAGAIGSAVIGLGFLGACVWQAKGTGKGNFFKSN